MQDPTDFLDVPMEEDPPVFANTHLLSRPPVPPGLQMPPGPLMPHYLQMLQRSPLPAGLEMPAGHLVNPSFQVCPCPSDPPCLPVPQVPPGPQVPLKAPSKEQSDHTTYTKEQGVSWKHISDSDSESFPLISNVWSWGKGLP